MDMVCTLASISWTDSMLRPLSQVVKLETQIDEQLLRVILQLLFAAIGVKPMSREVNHQAAQD